MLTVFKEGVLPDGSKLRLIRYVTPGECPKELVYYQLASMGYEKWRATALDHLYWRLYYRDHLETDQTSQVVDYLYFAEVDGVLCSRLWFAYSTRSGYGNFGNVFTEPEYRRRGLMKELLYPCVADFMASPAKVLCCASGTRHAVQAYLKAGFELIYDGETGPLSLHRPEMGRFLQFEKTAFAGDRIALIRPGTAAEQFDVDKFLYYTPAMLKHPRDHRVFAAARIQDYRFAWQEVQNGNGTITVAENAQGTVVGYAFVLKSFTGGGYLLDFRLHPQYCGDGHRLLEGALAQFGQFKGGVPVHAYMAAMDTERNDVVKASGARLAATLKGAELIGEKPEDVNVWQY